jgi:hypothetical protein
MNHLKTLTAIAVLSLNVIIVVSVSAQASFDLKAVLDSRSIDRAKKVMQDNEFVIGATSVGNFFANPIRLNGQPLDYNTFSMQSTGELTLVKGAPVSNTTVQIPFYIYLRRNGTIVKLDDEEALQSRHIKIDISTILKFALPNDQLIIEPVNKEDWQAKRILKMLSGGC